MLPYQLHQKLRTAQQQGITSSSNLSVLQGNDKLAIALRTAYANELSLDKEKTSYSDLLDAPRLACKMFNVT